MLQTGSLWRLTRWSCHEQIHLSRAPSAFIIPAERKRRRLAPRVRAVELSPNNTDTRNVPMPPQKGPSELSNWALKRIYASSLRLTVNVNHAQIREMIRRDFFSNGIWLDELDVLESVAKEIVNHRDEAGRTMRQIDPVLWRNAKEIVDLGAKVPFKDRHPAPKIFGSRREGPRLRKTSSRGPG